MLYMEQQYDRGKGWSRVFSDTDNERELQRFRCQVRASRAALHQPKDKKDRRHLILYGEPRMRATLMLAKDRQFNTALDRVQWELTQPQIMERHPEPYIR